MRIAFISFGYFPTIGGVEVMLHQQAQYFKSAGVQNYIITYSPNQKTTTENDAYSTIIRTPLLNRTHPDATAAKKLATWLPKILKQISPDIIYTHNATFPYGPQRTKAIVSAAKKQFPSIPLIEHAHNAQNAQHHSRATQKALASEAWDKIICVSKYARSQFEMQGIPRKKISIIYNGIDTGFFDPKQYNPVQLRKKYNLPPNTCYVVFPSRPFTTAGDLNIKKGVDIVAQAVAEVAKKGVPARLLAPKTEGHDVQKRDASFKKINALLVKLNAEKCVTFLTEFDHAAMPELYALGDIVVVPSVKEAFGLVYVEAMAMKKTLIAVRSGAAPEIITNRKNGFLVPDATSSAIAKTIQHIIGARKKDIARITSQARSTVTKRFSSKNFGKETLLLCQKMLPKNSV